MTGEGFRKTGFWAQFIVLGLVDWATIRAFQSEEVHWGHYVGFVVVNVGLIALTMVMWKWLRPQRDPAPRRDVPPP